ncbi:MAG: GntR family transcriptional regulator [Planctomycetes bacterium]|nr:GntR family transcriptional regulator [Planctomycetota bacterium]
MIPFSVTFKAGIPIYEQVIYAVKKAIVSGRLQEGDPFPSVREMSKELRINPNTAQKIVTLLVQEKLIEIKPGIGSIVSKLGNATEEQRHTILNTEAEKLVIEARRLSIKKGELIEAIQNHWGKGK